MSRSLALALLLTLGLAGSGQGFRLVRNRTSGASNHIESKTTATEVDHVSLAQQEVVGQAGFAGSTGTVLLVAAIVVVLAAAAIYAMRYYGATTTTPYPQTPEEMGHADSEADSNVCLEPDDPKDVVTMHERQSRRRTTTMFKESVEDQLESSNSGMYAFLNSVFGFVAQGGLCIAMVSINVYEAVMKKKAVKSADFDFVSIIIFQGFFSSALAFLIALKLGKLDEMFNKDTLKKIALYSPVGSLFAFTAYLQFVIFQFLAADVFKILEQGRLLMTAAMMWSVFGKKQSLSSWCALVVISFAAICYGQMSQLEKAVETGGADKSESNNFLIGFILTVVFIILNCGASVYSEYFLKKDHHLPFYIKKFYFEVPGTLFGMLLAWQLNPWMIETGWKQPQTVYFFVDGPFAGWNNHWVILCVLFFIVKSWGTGYLVQQMSSLVKQLCSVTSVGILYFFTLVHLEGECKPFKSPATGVDKFFCPGSFFKEISVNMVIADFCVLAAVTSYTLAQRDKSRKLMFKEQAAQAKEENAHLRGAKI